MPELKSHIILFDGVCVLCNSTVHWLLKHDNKKIFVFASLQSAEVQRLLQSYDIPSDMDSVVLIDNEGNVHLHSDVMLESFRLMGGWYRILYVFSWVPKPVRNWVYRLIARNRYKWFGKKDSCVLPAPEWRERFLDM